MAILPDKETFLEQAKRGNLVPVWAAGLGAFVLGEKLPLSSWLALVLILSGLILDWMQSKSQPALLI